MKLIYKLLQSGTFYYHIRNVATYSFFFSFSYCNLTEFKILSIYNLDSTIISNLGISYMASTPFMKMLNPYISVVCDCYQQYLFYCFPKYNIFNLVRRHQSLCHHKRGFRCNYQRAVTFSPDLDTGTLDNCLIREILHLIFR